VRYGYHLVPDCRKANQDNKSHNDDDVEATIIHHFNSYSSITATKAKPSTGNKQADILLKFHHWLISAISGCRRSEVEVGAHDMKEVH
jgi:hypothetical protein